MPYVIGQNNVKEKPSWTGLQLVLKYQWSCLSVMSGFTHLAHSFYLTKVDSIWHLLC